MSAAPKLTPVSVNDYLAAELNSPTKHEFTGGYVYAMAGGTNIHNAISVALVATLYIKLRGNPCQPFNSDTKVRIRLPTHTRFYYPDAMVVCNPNDPAEAFQDEPVIIAEVISEATRRIDEAEKRDAYLSIPSLATYLLIESNVPRVTVCQRTHQGFIQKSYDGLDAVIPLPSIATDLPLRDLYERVALGATNP